MDKHLREVAVLAGGVYFVQGALGIAAVTLPLFLRNLGWSIAEITTISSLAAFPWVLKIVYGLVSDCLPLAGYRRKSYLILFAATAVLGWLALLLAPDNKLSLMFALCLTNLGIAGTDVTTDGYIVENSEGPSSHIFQSIAWGARSLGAILSGVSGGWLAAHWQPRHVFLLTAALPLLIIAISLWIREPRHEKGPFISMAAPFKQCLRVIQKPNLVWFMMLLVISQVSACFGVPFFFHMKETLAFNETFLGTLMSLGWTGVVITSLFYAKWLSRCPPKRILYWALVLNALNIFSTLLIRSQTTALIFVLIGGILSCLTLLPIMSVSAILTHQTGVEGTLFAILMSIHNLGQIVFGFIGGRLIEFVDLSAMITGSGILSLLGLYVVGKLRFDHGTTTAPAESPQSA